MAQPKRRLIPLRPSGLAKAKQRSALLLRGWKPQSAKVLMQVREKAITSTQRKIPAAKYLGGADFEAEARRLILAGKEKEFDAAMTRLAKDRLDLAIANEQRFRVNRALDATGIGYSQSERRIRRKIFEELREITESGSSDKLAIEAYKSIQKILGPVRANIFVRRFKNLETKMSNLKLGQQ